MTTAEAIRRLSKIIAACDDVDGERGDEISERAGPMRTVILASDHVHWRQEWLILSWEHELEITE